VKALPGRFGFGFKFVIKYWLAFGLFPVLCCAETVVPPPASYRVPHPGSSSTVPPSSPVESTPLEKPSAAPEEAAPPDGKGVDVGPPKPDPNRIEPAVISPQARARAKALALYAQALRVESHSRDPAAALPIFQEIVELDPKFVKAHLQVAYYYFRLRQYKDALEHLETALRENPDSGDLKSAASRAYYLMGEHDKAETLAREVLAADPHNLHAYRALVEIFVREERPDAIEELIQDVLKSKVQDKDEFMQLTDIFHRGLVNAGMNNTVELAKRLQPLYQLALKEGVATQRLYTMLADCASKLGEPKEAIKYARLAIKQDPEDDLHYRRLATYLVEAKDYQEALKAARKAWDLSPYEESTWQLLVKLYLELDQPQKAVDVLLKVIEIAPQNNSAYRLLATLYAEMKNPEKAADVLVKAAQRFPNNTQLALLCALLLQEQQRYQDGIKLLELTVRANPTHPRLYLVLANMYEQERDNKNAEANYRQAISLDIKNPQAYTGLAWALARQDQTEAAAATLAQARELFPTSANVAISEAVIARMRKQYREALTSLVKYEALMEENSGEKLPEGFYLEKGITHEMLEQWEEAEKALQQGLAVHPNSERTHLLQNALAYHWAERNRNLKEAQALSEASLQTKPKNGEYLDTLGWIYFRQGNYKKALPLLQNAALATQNDSVVLDHLAQVYLKLGRKDKAIEIWKQLLKDDPKDEDLPRNDEIRDRLLELGVTFEIEE